MHHYVVLFHVSALFKLLQILINFLENLEAVPLSRSRNCKVLDQVVLFQLLFRSKYCFIYKNAIRINVRTAAVDRGALLVFAFVIIQMS